MNAPLANARNPRIPRVALLIESSRSSGRALLRGVADFARSHGPWEFYWEPGGIERAWTQLRTLPVSGIILRDSDGLEAILARGIPTVVIGHSRREIPGQANVVTDSDSIAALAADHLLSCGFQHFAFCGLQGLPWSDLREDGFQRHLAARGFTVHTYRPPTAGRIPPNRASERRRLSLWLKSIPRPFGLMACNDDRGEQVIEACKLAGLRVPDEAAIIGADNDELVCDLSDPPMSSVAINFHRAGFEAAQVLHRLLRGEPVRDLKITGHATHVVVRRSTDIVAVEDPGLAHALRFIRETAHTLISVPDVARAAGVSRRVLEKRFQRTLRRSALQEIRRVRVEQLCRLLVETNEPIAQIALAFGYPGPEHLARYFRIEKQMTPLAFRQRYGRR